jgi:hypothetical protein
MLEVGRAEARVRTQSPAVQSSWGIVDVILAILMLPFGLWMWLIETMVRAVALMARR